MNNIISSFFNHKHETVKLEGNIHKFLLSNWFIYPLLTNSQKKTVLKFIDIFCQNTSFIFSIGIEKQNEITWLVAANAAMIGSAQKTDFFSTIKWVYLHTKKTIDIGISGKAIGVTTIHLNADNVIYESINQIQGQQVVMHEFAHVLDFMFGLSGSLRSFIDGFNYHLSLLRSHTDDVVNESRSFIAPGQLKLHTPVEFFAYATEAFFTNPSGFYCQYPDMYQDMVSIYGLDFNHQLQVE